jgi:hypothetical protein
MGEIVRHGIHKNPTPPPDRAREQPLLHLRCRDAEEEETFIETNKAKNNISKIGEQGFPPPQTEHSTKVFSKIANRQNTFLVLK